jgi:acyl-CoA reductase-like NAD-dependent aldehyde dehydrogenase
VSASRRGSGWTRRAIFDRRGNRLDRVRGDLYIDGAFVPAASAARIELVNPATEDVFASVVDANEGDVAAAVTAARRALSTWRESSAAERAAVLLAIADGIGSRAAELDALVTQENGAPRAWASFVGSGAQHLYRACAATLSSFQRDELRTSPAGRSAFRNDPIGVVAAIVPWNSPQVLTAAKIGPALAAGCTVVLKPSPETTLDAMLLAEVIRDAGVPGGVVNVVSGGRETGAALVRNTGVDMVSFTGSTGAGREIASMCGSQLKRVSAELGGKSAVVLLEDADMEDFAASIATDVLPYSGQVCYANTRVLVHRARLGEAVDALCEFISRSPVGDPTDASTVFGPLVSAAARAKVEGYIASGRDAGARAVVGGGRPTHTMRGFYVEPTVFVDVHPSMPIFQDEIFGPVLVVVPFADDDEAVALANDSNYGLAGAVFGRDDDHAMAIAQRLDTGRIIVNRAAGASRYSSLYKTSGLGTVGELGPSNYLAPRNITLP